MKKILFKILIIVALVCGVISSIIFFDIFILIAFSSLLVASLVAVYQWHSLPKEVREMRTFWVQESSFGLWYYHITENGKSLCNTEIDILDKRLPMENWGIDSPHIHERYCKKCKEIYDEINKSPSSSIG